MKKSLFLLVIWVLTSAIASATGLYGDEDYIVKFEKGDEPKTIVVRLANLINNTTEVTIQDLDGKVWFYKFVKGHMGFATQLDLNGLPDNNYVVYASNVEGLFSQAFMMNDDGIRFFEKPVGKMVTEMDNAITFKLPEKGKFLIRFSDDGEMGLTVMMKGLHNKPAGLNIISMGYNCLAEENIDEMDEFAKRFDMTEMCEGHHMVYAQSYDASVALKIMVENNQIAFEDIQVLERTSYATSSR